MSVVVKRALPLMCAGLIAIVAVADHRHKNRLTNRLEAAEWYCVHDGTRCGGARSADLERRWNEREVVYKGAFGVLTVVGAASMLGFRVRRR